MKLTHSYRLLMELYPDIRNLDNLQIEEIIQSIENEDFKTSDASSIDEYVLSIIRKDNIRRYLSFINNNGE